MASRPRSSAASSRKINAPMPVAAAMTTDSSPIVSHARMSTNVTLTMLVPPP